MFDWIVRADHKLLLLNTLHLVVIAFLPFPTAVSAEAFHTRSQLSEIRPSPFFQPPNAKTGAPLDLSHVEGIAFSPHDEAAGHLALSRLVLE